MPKLYSSANMNSGCQYSEHLLSTCVDCQLRLTSVYALHDTSCYGVIPGETNMKNGQPLQISPIIGACAGSVRISYQYKYL